MPEESDRSPIDRGRALTHISQFFGIVIAMNCSDALPPHFHASYDEHEALISIETLDFVHGWLPTRAYALVLEWAVHHRAELTANWSRARQGASPFPIIRLE